MPFTGDLEHLHIVDVIQLIHTARKSGTVTVRGSTGESRIIFSNGYIVGATHLNNKVRIGTVLVKMNAISREDLEMGLQAQKKAEKDRKPLITTLIELGKLSHDEAARGLKKLIEMTIVEMIGWTSGTFTFDTEAISVSDKCSYAPDKMEQEVILDAQMLLMDALRIFDERERDRKSGISVESDEDIFADVIIPEQDPGKEESAAGITAEDLGLDDLDQLEKKIPTSIAFDDALRLDEIHHQKIRESLGDFSEEAQQSFTAFLNKYTVGTGSVKAKARMEKKDVSLILFSADKLIKHSVMTICKHEGIPVFATEEKDELDRLISQCIEKGMIPVAVFDAPGTSETWLPAEKIVSLRKQVRAEYPRVPNIQLASPGDYHFTMQAYDDGIHAVFPKPSMDNGRESFIPDTIHFLTAFNSYTKGLMKEQTCVTTKDQGFAEIQERILALRGLQRPSDVSLTILECIAEMFERSITFVVRPTELIGEKSIGIDANRETGPVSAADLQIPLTYKSVFRDVIKKGGVFYGDFKDSALDEHLLSRIGRPLRSQLLLVPLKTHWKTMALIYADFGGKEVSSVSVETIEILANAAGMAMENTLYRTHMKKTTKK
jgi:ribosomal protein L7Ae-like RNA K-turn-binding protein